ncbi:glutathione S-transferase [Ilyonectria destructans]|nr:glutathione S-transferase [Ilyonectria destructans]
MSSIGTIWTYPFNPRAMEVQAVVAVNGWTVDHAPDFAMGKTNKTPEFLADFPMGRVPTLKSATGLVLFESDTIAQYIAESGPASAQLLGATAEERAVIRQWIGFADHELFEPLTTLLLWRYGMALFKEEEAEKSAFQRLDVSLTVLEKQLQGCRYIASEQLSLADISVAASLYWGFAQVLDLELRAKFSQTVEWYLRNFIETRKTSPSQ